MQFRALRTFAAVAETLSFRQGAMMLGVRQPTVSRQIRDLEEALGVDLFERHPGEGVRLTTAGRHFLPKALRILADFDSACAEAARMGQGESGCLSVGFTASLAGGRLRELLPEIRSRVTVDGVVAVIDAEATAAGRFTSTPEELARPDHDNPLEEVFDDQLLCADMVLLNKIDLVDANGLDRAQARMADKLRPGVKVIATRHAAIDPVVLLGLDAAAEDDLDSRPSLHDSATDHDHDDFDSFAIPLPEITDPDALADRLRQVIVDHDILRLKGFLAVEGKAARQVVQAVGARLESYYDRPWKPGEERKGHLVVIGRKGLECDRISTSVLDKLPSLTTPDFAPG